MRVQTCGWMNSAILIHFSQAFKSDVQVVKNFHVIQGRQLRRWLLVSLYAVMWTAEVALMCSEYVQFLSANMFSVEPFCASKDINVQSACTN
jgi:hypothetical protein